MSELRLLVCVDTSRAALAAARLAVRLAAEHGGRIRAVSVVEDGDTARQLDARGATPAPHATGTTRASGRYSTASPPWHMTGTWPSRLRCWRATSSAPSSARPRGGIRICC